MLNAREKLILKNLLHHKYRRAKDLANELNLSEKTVRISLKNLERLLKKNGAEIISKSGSGYYLNVFDAEKFNMLLENMDREEKSTVLPEERIQELLRRLIFHEKVIKDAICDTWFISEKTFQNDLKALKDRLKAYDLQIGNRQNKEYYLEGLENNIRRCTIEMLSLHNLIQSPDYQSVKDCVLYYLDFYHFKMSDLAIENLVKYLIIAIVRIQNNHCILIPIASDDIHEKVEFQIASGIASAISSKYNIIFSLLEIEYLAIHLISKKTNESYSNFIVRQDIDSLITEILELIYKTFRFDLRADFELRVTLYLHFEPMVNRLIYGLTMENPILNEVKERYALAYQMAVVSDTVIEKRYHKHLSEDEIGYVAMYFQLALERKKDFVQKKRVLMICNLGKVSSSMMKYRYMEMFSETIEAIDTCGIHELKKIDLNQYDYILSTIHIEERLPIPVLEISFFADEQDVEKIRKNLNRNDSQYSFFDSSLFFSHLKCSTREEVLHFMCRELSDHEGYEKNLYTSVMERENLANTDYCYRMAIPHPTEIFGKRTICCVGILDKPIFWDRQLVQLVMLISIAEDNSKKDFLQLLSKFSVNKNKIKKLIKNQSYENFLEIMKETSREVRSEEK